MRLETGDSNIKKSRVSGLRSPVSGLLSGSGFSLVEIIVAISILSIGLVGAIRVFPVGLRASHRAEMVSRSTLIAERTLESLKLSAWEDLVPGETTDQDAPFDMVVTIDQPELDGLTDATRLKRLSVTVNWVQDGRVRSVTAVTLFNQPASSG
ncbi:MAG: hypothetical protein FD129_2600 [bacterium]|nr:MAG: hypothetical protein FD129_2600 [bacterium]